LVLGVVAGGSASINILTLHSQFIDQLLKVAPAGTDQATLDHARQVLQTLIDRGQITIEPGIGIILSAVGGLVAMVGGILILTTKREQAPAVVAAPETGAPTGAMATGPLMGGGPTAAAPIPPEPSSAESPETADPLPTTDRDAEDPGA
jgi:hypothetical protein